MGHVMSTQIERRIVYTYGPKGLLPPFQNAVSGFKTWEELEAKIRDDRWGSPFNIIERQERTITYGEWENVRSGLGHFS